MRKDEQLKRFYRRKVAQKGFAKAKCAAGRKLGATTSATKSSAVEHGRR